MTYVVTFQDFTPPVRIADDAWLEARVEEAATRTGAFTAIDTITLTPVDQDPGDPQPRSLTTTKAALTVGWYRIVWSDFDGNEAPTDPIFNAPYRPSPDDVAKVLRTRTSARGGTLHQFTASTDPTAEEVGDLIDDALEAVTAQTGTELPGRVYGVARRVIALKAALLVEIGSASFDRDRYDRLKTTADEWLLTLMTAITEIVDGGEPGPTDGVGGTWAPIGLQTARRPVC